MQIHRGVIVALLLWTLWIPEGYTKTQSTLSKTTLSNPITKAVRKRSYSASTRWQVHSKRLLNSVEFNGNHLMTRVVTQLPSSGRRRKEQHLGDSIHNGKVSFKAAATSTDAIHFSTSFQVLLTIYF